MTRPLLLDLFCGAGGAAMGYWRAGFDVVGIDIKPQPRYPFEFIQDDAMEVLVRGVYTMPFAAIHASPPCQRYIRGGLQDTDKHPDLLPATRGLLTQTQVPWVIENVPGAPMRCDVELCGSMFGLPIRRHRWFESSVPLAPWVPAHDHSRPVVGVYGNPHGEAGAWPGMLPGSLETWREALGIEWMTSAELSDAIPPDYTQHIGEQLLAHLVAAA